MSTVLRWLLRAFFALAGLGLLALIALYFFLSRSLPEYSASYEVPGLTAPMEIVRDTANVPHVMGQTDADSFYGLGFVHAQDRLWQMTVLRRTAQGKLSEIFGGATIRTDDLLRRLDLYGAAQSSVAAQSPETLAALEAYSAGVNAWISLVNQEAMGRGAPEFFLFPPEIAPWQPADSIALLKLMGLQLSDHLNSEVLRARTSLLVPPERLRDILPDVPGSAVIDLPDYASLVPGVSPAQAVQTAEADMGLLWPVPPRGFSSASNAWAVAPERSATGSTLLAADPHLGLSAPSLLYLAHINLQSGGVIGATIPGVPAMLLGRSDKLGWGLTTAYLDDQDIVLERLVEGASDSYLSPEGPRPFETRRSVISVADALPITITLRFSENGPVIPGGLFDLAAITPPGHVAALAWTALDPRDTTMTGALKLMQAQSVDEAILAGSFHVAPAQNLILADTRNIALQMIGRQPKRDPANASQGRLPVLGDRRKNLWDGYLPYRANPSVVNPPGGIVGNTNNKTTDAPFPAHVSFDWGDTQRIQRWSRLMQARQVHTRASFIEAQLDTVSMTARTLLPLIGRELWFEDRPAAAGTPDRLRQDALALLVEWNGEMNEHMPEPLIYAAWIRSLNMQLIRDELGPLADEYPHADPLFLERVFRDTDGASIWCDLSQTERRETCIEIARRALDAALRDLAETYGPNIESWRWGDAHEAAHDHPVLGELPVLGALVNIRQSTSGGDDTLMRGRTSGAPEHPFRNVHASAFRGVYDFSDPDSSLFILSTGQSGHPLSRHYDDLGELWRQGEYVRMSLDIDLARAGGTGVTVLTPEETN